MEFIYFGFCFLMFCGFLFLSRITLEARKESALYKEIGNNFRLVSIENCERADKLESQFDKTCKEIARLQVTLREYENLITDLKNQNDATIIDLRQKIKDMSTELVQTRWNLNEMSTRWDKFFDEDNELKISPVVEDICYNLPRLKELKSEIRKYEKSHTQNKNSNFGSATHGMNI